MRQTLSYFIAALLWVTGSLLYAQDAQLLNQYDYVGTARYTGMAGAMAAVGADPSAVLDNPAGLGLFRRFDVSLTLHEQLDYTHQRGDSRSQFHSSFMLPQVSFVFAFENKNTGSALQFCNFMVSYNRLHTFHRKLLGQNANQPTIANLMLDQVDGLSEATVSGSGFNNPTTGWLSEMGYQTWMIDPYDIDQYGDTIWDTWSSYYNTQPANGYMSKESGSIDEFNLHWGALFSHHFSLGLGLNIRSLEYYKESTYEEVLTTDYQNYAQINSRLHQKGIGVSGTIGILYQPIRPLRMGLSFQTPTALRLTTRTSGDMYLQDGTLKGECSTLVSRNEERMTQPMRVTAGMAFLFDKYALVSMQYDFRHHKTTNDMHTFHIGGEVVLSNNFFLNLGYAYETAFLADEQPTLLPLNSVRTDAEYRTIGSAHIVGAGAGYRNRFIVVHLGYRYRQQRYNIYPFASEYITPDPYDMTATTHNIVLTLGWHTSR